MFVQLVSLITRKMSPMKYYPVRLTVCGIMLFITACVTKSPVLTATPILPPPTATIPLPTETLLPTSDVMAEIDSMLNKLVEIGTFSSAALIARNGEVLLSQGHGLADRDQNIPNASQTNFRIGSLTKQFTAMAILILQAQNKLNVQDSICNYLTDCSKRSLEIRKAARPWLITDALNIAPRAAGAGH